MNRHTLANGLRIVHHEDTTTQMVAVNLLYNVGARHEDAEHTGYAHLLEHLMFEGSTNIPCYDTHVQLAGGENNAWTSNDLTNYYITVPRSNVETAFWLESDRMTGLALTEESLEVQKGVVIEEFKQRHLNRPYGDVQHHIRALAYKVHPYRWPTIGLCVEHIERATLETVQDFYRRHYRPSNAILSVVGGIRFKEVVKLAEKWFGPLENPSGGKNEEGRGKREELNQNDQLFIPHFSPLLMILILLSIVSSVLRNLRTLIQTVLLSGYRFRVKSPANIDFRHILSMQSVVWQ